MEREADLCDYTQERWEGAHEQGAHRRCLDLENAIKNRVRHHVRLSRQGELYPAIWRGVTRNIGIMCWKQ